MYRFNRVQKSVALFLFFVIAVIVTSLALMGTLNKWFSDKNTYYTEFNSMAGIKRGTRVVFKDNEWVIGEVSDFKLNSRTNKIRVYLKIFKEHESKIRKNSIVSLTSGLFGIGGSKIEISIGSKNFNMIKDNQLILSSDVRSEGDDMSAIKANVRGLLEPDSPLIKTIVNIEGITRQLKDGGAIPQINQLIGVINKDVRKSLRDINSVTGDISELVHRNKLRVDNTLLNTTKEINNVVLELSKFTKTLLEKLLLESDPLIKDLRKNISDSLRDITLAISVLGKSLKRDVPGAMKDIRVTIQNIKVITNKVNRILDDVEGLIPPSKKRKRGDILIDNAKREDY